MAKPYKRKDSRFYWAAPTIGGIQVRQSLGTTDYDEAIRRLRILEGKVAGNPQITPRTDRGSVAALLELVRTHYKVNDLRSLRHLESRIDLHLAPMIGHIQAGKLTSAVLGDYILLRKHNGANVSSINRELAILKRAFTLGMEAGEVSARPVIKMLPGEKAQSGFFTEAGYRSLLRHANPLLHDILILLWHTGWRIDSVIKLEWANVNFQRGIVGLRAEQTKNKKATAFPLEPFPELKTMLEWRYELTKKLEKEKRQLIPFVFHREGEPVLSIVEGWHFARARAGLPGRKLHDFRRTACMRLEELGWTETEIMNMIGLKTLSIFIRYNISNEERILAKAKKIVAAQSKHSTS